MKHCKITKIFNFPRSVEVPVCLRQQLKLNEGGDNKYCSAPRPASSHYYG